MNGPPENTSVGGITGPAQPIATDDGKGSNDQTALREHRHLHETQR